MSAPKVRIATATLAGCFGCHMSILDIDEKLFDLAAVAEFDRSPITDIKHCGPCDIGIIEGGVCNAENVEVLREFRNNCRILIACGACAITGGIPALRNGVPIEECMAEAYLDGVGTENPSRTLPNDPELPLLLNQVHPIQEVVRVDYFLPGCPPPAEAIWQVVSDLLAGREPKLEYSQLHYD